jgi:hypothetical protein
MKIRALLATVAMLAASNASAAAVSFVENLAERYVDIMYTVSAGGEFTNWDLRATPAVGSILDPTTTKRDHNIAGGAAPVDTFANTVFSSVGAGPASYVFTEYNPGSSFPPVPAQPAPTFGAALPNPDELNWSIFDTNVGDGNIPGSFPYLMGRVVYSDGGTGVITAHFFDTTNAGVGEAFTYIYNIPEPASIALASLGLIGCVTLRRKK